MKKNKLKIPVGILVTLFLIFLAWRIIILVSPESAEDFKKTSTSAVAVEIEPILIDVIQEIKVFTGTVYPEYHYTLASKVPGILKKLTAEIGDRIHEDEPVAKIDDAEYQQALIEAQASLKSAEASLAEAKSQLELAELNLNRMKAIQDKGFGSLTELETAQTSYNSALAKTQLAVAQLEQKRAALHLAKIKLENTILKASKPGYIAEKFIDEGNLVSVNTPIVSIVGIDEVIIKTHLTEKIYEQIEIGQLAEVITEAIPEKRFIGNVTRIAPVLDEISRTAEVEIAVDNSSHQLKPGMFCKIFIILENRENAQIVPARAIVMLNGKKGIYIADPENKKAHFVPVKTGITSEQRVEILEPNIDGFVITIGQYQLKDGSMIIIPDSIKKDEVGTHKDTIQ